MIWWRRLIMKVFDILHEFYTPTKIEYSLLTFSKDVASGETFDFRPSGGTSRTIQSTEGISFQKLMEDIENINLPQDGIKNIRIIDIVSGKTNVFLNGKDSYIDRNSRDLYKCWDYDKIYNGCPTSDLFSINIHHTTPRKSVDTIYEIIFWTHTDIWFEDTEIGLINRNRLRDIFKMLYDTFDVVDTFFDSSMFDDTKMKNIVFG